eukprot:CAMPEP_0198504830 /NCGR_PEP_ID=MMETSP1462-20131121/10696_1 /TAXON_ID=1333877 /ORGANISM="Brandtodinium nutriculum, Strain RCC3387" /LENGTH=621 /DNA_ID=CAMNT_0044234003 /DNA_START=90 /DNA_END=1952 /DNA_ORIENTATION=+
MAPSNDVASATWDEWKQAKESASAAVQVALHSHFTRQEELLSNLLRQMESSGQSDTGLQGRPNATNTSKKPTLNISLSDESTSPGKTRPAQLSSLMKWEQSSCRTRSHVHPCPEGHDTAADAALGATLGSQASHDAHRASSKGVTKAHREKLAFLQSQHGSTPGTPQPDYHQRSVPLRQMLIWREWFMQLEEPTRSGPMHRVLSHRWFDGAVVLVIVLNAAYTTYQLDYEMRTMGKKPQHDAVIEAGFLFVFMVEIAAKLWVHKLYLFCNEDMAWNIFDLGLVFFSLLDQIFDLIARSLGNVAFARSLRVFKVGKILRVVRAIGLLRELNVMVRSLLGCFLSLFWASTVLGVILFIFALFFVQQMQMHLQDLPEELRQGTTWDLQRQYFQSVVTAIGTLGMCTTGGKDWEEIYDVVAPLGAFCSFAWAFYITFFTFAAMNILTGIFVDGAMKLAKPDEQEELIESNKKMQRDIGDMTDILDIIDTDGDGLISCQDFTQAMADPWIGHAMRTLGVEIKDASLFFRTLAKVSNQDALDIREFAVQIVQMKGVASSVDLHGLILQNAVLQRNMSRLRVDQAQMMQKLADFVDAGPASKSLTVPNKSTSLTAFLGREPSADSAAV